MAPRLTPSRGAKPDKLARDAIHVALNREATDAEGKPNKRLYVIADNVTQLAAEGDIQAIKEVFARVDGKATQSLDGDLTVRSDVTDLMEAIDGRTRGLPPGRNRPPQQLNDS